ncbi:helix-turn-helix domain-containing protein [Kordia sp.]|uniref:helix-turn-helix domain-containing protein n=1 Tax=Kordia sp. TaxID=1965332 RepID=UPI003D6C245A
MSFLHRYLLLLFLIFTVNLFGQQNQFHIPDSLKAKSFEELQGLYYMSESTSETDSIIANTYLKKALIKNDTINSAIGYSFLMPTTDNLDLREEYVNKAILLTKNNPSYQFPCMLYSFKASLYNERKDFKTALDYYLLAHDSAVEVGNVDFANTMKLTLGVLKNNVGMYDDGLKYARESWSFMKSKPISETYLNSLFLISSAYINNNKLDSASIFNSIGIKKAVYIESDTHYSRFSFLEGVNQFKKNNYKVCIDSIEKSIIQLKVDNDLDNVAESYYYIGKSYWNTKDYKKSLFYLKKMDSIFLKTNSLIPFCRDGYKTLINYYKKNGNTKRQLLYTSRLLKLDSILDSNYEYLSTNIYQKFETPNLIAEKEQLIDSLNEDNSSFWNYFYILLFTTLSITTGLIFNFFKRKKDLRKFTDIISELNTKVEHQKSIIDAENNIILKSETKDIDEIVVKNTLLKLEKFEKELGFTNNRITLQTLSKKVGTNSKYLSKIINLHKQKSFSNYLNDLRIEYVISKLHSDKKFRKYSMQAIAEEVGFSSNRSFFGVFQKKTGISPSYFITELNKNDK